MRHTALAGNVTFFATMDDKIKLRAMLRQRRNQLDAADQLRAAENLVAQIKTLPAFCESSRVALYIANDGEIDPAAVLEWCVRHGKVCYVPVIIAGEKELQFSEINHDTQFTRNRFGINEPVAARANLIAAHELDLVLLPLVGFDRHGNRIGMGGGFYDTTLAFKKTAPHTSQTRPQLIGLAHEIQRVDSITADRWDIPISAVVTEQTIYQCTVN